MLVLGVETSCDETAAALYDSQKGLLAHALYSQADLHTQFGGVVPELAARDHVRKLIPMLRQVCRDSGCELADLNAVAYTAGPGLVGALLVGATLSRTLAWALDIPALAIHHMEGHLLAPLLEDSNLAFPFLALLVSGGHTLLVSAEGLGVYRILGESVDDAAGEAFDKTAKLLGLPYPGGPVLEELAEKGTPGRFRFTSPMINKPGLNFSFSGLKTQVMVKVRALQKAQLLDEQTRADIALAFQNAAVEALVIKCRRAVQATGADTLIISGGVSANKALRKALNDRTKRIACKLHYPALEFCTDNGAMIAFAGCLRLQAGAVNEPLSIFVKPRWPLTELRPPSAANADVG